ncbi:hypothetical protein BU23DRAFT_306103 [Bimuria novae-zelandiae CBS 107.79]|uniref:Uncharacterized protein n=1 Tax=Bimuria novae-zelandiae CBS 107.79 TaxID=1447943 RepID=A0A6A5USF0_9PLEO|nr:hypothetical protein BU23DRAFT_306103 [Bimuria novae-zelandiae CBS 107.79]
MESSICARVATDVSFPFCIDTWVSMTEDCHRIVTFTIETSLVTTLTQRDRPQTAKSINQKSELRRNTMRASMSRINRDTHGTAKRRKQHLKGSWIVDWNRRGMVLGSILQGRREERHGKPCITGVTEHPRWRYWQVRRGLSSLSGGELEVQKKKKKKNAEEKRKRRKHMIGAGYYGKEEEQRDVYKRKRKGGKPGMDTTECGKARANKQVQQLGQKDSRLSYSTQAQWVYL